MFARLVFALLAVSAARAQYSCGEGSKGYPTSQPVQLERKYMDPGYRNYSVDLNPNDVNRYCPDGLEATFIWACDYDYAPQVKVITLTHAEVYRTGSVLYEGYIDTILYCASSVADDVRGSVVRVVPAQNAAPAPRVGVAGMPVY
ncbi:hypothetical protein ABMA27_012957 [Loxostege sticticalis]|uniref:Uncharacterized protein n=1 Tax=Loxostege sticticalis TaxID=481309 RepID=A0ABR3IDJ2_LOXSC